MPDSTGLGTQADLNTYLYNAIDALEKATPEVPENVYVQDDYIQHLEDLPAKAP